MQWLRTHLSYGHRHTNIPVEKKLAPDVSFTPVYDSV